MTDRDIPEADWRDDPGGTPLRRLEFFVAAGIDLPIGEEAVDRFQPPPAAAPRRSVPEPGSDSRPAQTVPTRPAFVAPDAAAMEARRLAISAPDLETLERLYAGFDGCALKATANRLVFADGRAGAPLMIIGEAPGRDEDEIGRPFVGRAGQLLDRMLAAIGLTREGAYITNLVPWRPPGNRTPTPQEVGICLPFLRRQIELAAPKILLTMGAPASQTLLDTRDGILRLRGQWAEYRHGDLRLPVLATLHPAYLLRQPAQKALAWRDLRALQAKLETLPPAPAPGS